MRCAAGTEVSSKIDATAVRTRLMQLLPYGGSVDQLKCLGDDAHCRLRQSVPREIVTSCPTRVGGVRPVGECPGHDGAFVIEQNKVIFHAVVFTSVDTIENLDEPADTNDEAGLLAHFPGDRLCQCFADLDGTAWKTPLAFERLMGTFDEDHTIIVDDHGADTDDRPLGIPPHFRFP